MTLTADLHGHAALVTGAAGELGRHLALTLARAGAKVALASRRVSLLAPLVETITGFDGRAIPLFLDVTDLASIRAAVETAEQELGALTILVNNSGVAEVTPLLELDEAAWQAVIDTNLTGAWRVATEVARHMVRLGHGGSIINIASLRGTPEPARATADAAAKAGLVQLTRVMALELARHNIRVNAIALGLVETELNRDHLGTEEGRALIRQIPQRRPAQPSDLDGALLLLASEASRYITGSVLAVDGGAGALVVQGGASLC